ncbi:MAG TPA: penicillin-binding protein activator [Chitinophagaceae bacterium]
MKKILLLLSLFIGLSFIPAKTKPAKTIVKVGALLSLTGNWSTLGITSQEALLLAVKEINARLEQTGSHYRFELTVYDTKMEPSLAQSYLSEAYKTGIRYIVGPQSSAEVEAIRNYANSKGILVVSQGSTAGTLAIPDDAIYRFCPDDALQGDVMAEAIYGAGYRSVILLSRDDEGNRGLQQSVSNAFTSRGGIADAIAPWPGNIADFNGVLSELKKKIDQHNALYGAGKVAVYLSSFDRAKELFNVAASDPVFSSVHWYGGDGLALSSELLSDPVTSLFAAKTKFFAPRLSFPQQVNPELVNIAEAIKIKTGIEADAYTLAAYDALWVIAKTVTAFPEPPKDFALTKEMFQKEANQYYGITGPIWLNGAGDRSAGTYDYWGIVAEAGSYTWKWVGKSW